MIQVQGITFTQGGKELLAEVSLATRPGHVTVVLGPEGSGKTTLADVICGALKPDAGSVIIDGHDLAGESAEARRHVGYMPQDPSVYRDMTPRGQLRFVGQLLEITNRALEDRVEKALRRTGLTNTANRPIRSMPRAVMQRVTLAQALMTGAGNIVLDDPTDGLDAKQIFELRSILKDICDQPGENGEKPAVLLLTDNLTEACQLGGFVYVLEGGRIVGSGDTDQIAWIELDDEKTVLRVLGGADDVRACAEKAGVPVEDCIEDEPGLTRCVAQTGKGLEGRKALFAAFAAANLPVVDMRPAKRSMEEFVMLLKSETASAAAAEGEGAEQA